MRKHIILIFCTHCLNIQKIISYHYRILTARFIVYRHQIHVSDNVVLSLTIKLSFLNTYSYVIGHNFLPVFRSIIAMMFDWAGLPLELTNHLSTPCVARGILWGGLKGGPGGSPWPRENLSLLYIPPNDQDLSTLGNAFPRPRLSNNNRPDDADGTSSRYLRV